MNFLVAVSYLHDIDFLTNNWSQCRLFSGFGSKHSKTQFHHPLKASDKISYEVYATGTVGTYCRYLRKLGLK